MNQNLSSDLDMIGHKEAIEIIALPPLDALDPDLNQEGRMP